MKNKNNKSKNSNNKSQKGKRNGMVGAPAKPVKWPNRPFTMVNLFTQNNNQCQLSLRNKVTDAVECGEIVVLKPRKQPKGSVGRPMSVFVVKESFDEKTMEKADKKTSGKNSKKKTPSVTTAVSTSPIQPAVAPVDESVVNQTPTTVVSVDSPVIESNMVVLTDAASVSSTPVMEPTIG
jgi:hypothetical protein